jgi:hypothetical protein
LTICSRMPTSSSLTTFFCPDCCCDVVCPPLPLI